MGTITTKIYTPILSLSIIGLTWALVWFAFIYYPKIVDDYKSGRVPQKPILTTVAASSQNLPIETPYFRLVYENRSNSYYVFVEGNKLSDYLTNRDAARLTLKTALSAHDLCDYSVTYVSTARLQIPQSLQNPDDC